MDKLNNIIKVLMIKRKWFSLKYYMSRNASVSRRIENSFACACTRNLAASETSNDRIEIHIQICLQHVIEGAKYVEKIRILFKMNS